jgi:hypothetical protein
MIHDRGPVQPLKLIKSARNRAKAYCRIQVASTDQVYRQPEG